MKSVSLTGMSVLLLVLLIIGVSMLAGRTQEHLKGVLGAPLLDHPLGDGVASIVIKGRSGASILKKTPEGWAVEDRYQYPAEFSKISNLLFKLERARIGWQIEPSDAVLNRLSLRDSGETEIKENEKGTWIIVRDDSEQTLLSVLVGEAWRSKGLNDGHYIRTSNRSPIYLIGMNFSDLSENPADWLEKTLIEVKAEEIRGIACYGPNQEASSWFFERPERGEKFKCIRAPIAHGPEYSVLHRLEWALTYLQIEDVADPLISHPTKGMADSICLEYLLYNGLVYRVYPGRSCAESGECYLRVEVGFTENEERAASAEDMSMRAKQLNDRLSPWTYQISEGSHSNFITSLDPLIQ